jgi:Holliday junction DNA helicase RuvA
MISRVRGTLESVEPVCVVSVGGVGFELQIPEKDRAALKGVSGEVSLHTYLYVREDRLTLFGFRNAEVGEHPTARIVEAVRSEDHAFLCGLPGLGRKTAERLTVELKDKLGHLAVTEGAATTGVPSNLREEAILALTTLGMQRGVAERALEHVDWKSKDESSLASIVKQALRHASGA